jgi:hypothetical protein
VRTCFVVRMLVNPFSWRDFALYAPIELALLRRNRRSLGYLFAFRAFAGKVDLLYPSGMRAYSVDLRLLVVSLVLLLPAGR